MHALYRIAASVRRLVPLAIAAIALLAPPWGNAIAAIAFGGSPADIGVLADVPECSLLADLDGDGDLDLVAGARTGSDFEVIAWENAGFRFGGGSWIRHGIGALSDAAFSIAAADLDRDGDLDLVVGANAGESFEVVAWENDGAPFDGPWTRRDIGASGTSFATVVAAGDLDGDGWTDVVSVAHAPGAAGSVIAWRNDGAPFDGPWTGSTVFSSINLGPGMALADFDGDGALDMAINHNEYSVSMFRNDGTPFDGAWTGNFVGYGCAGFVGEIVVADFDCDSFFDIFTSCGYQPSYSQRIWRNDGTPFTGTWAYSEVGSVAATCAAAADLDFDGDPDLVMGSAGGEVSAWENDGTPFSGAWTKAFAGATSSAVTVVTAGNVDFDGDPEIVAVSGTAVGQDRIARAWENLARASVSVAPLDTLAGCSAPVPYAFSIAYPGAEPANVRGYEVVFSVDPAVATIANPLADVVEGPFLASAGPTQFYAVDEGSGLYSASCVILGGDTGAAGNAVLFTALLTPVAQGTSPVAIASVKLRDLDNNELPVVWSGGSIRLDCTAPTMDAIAEAQGGWYNAAPALSHAGFDDDLNLDLAEYNYDGGAWTAIFSGVDAASWDADPWTLPGFASLGEGAHTIWFRVRDDAGNWNAGTYGWQFYKDTVPPPAPTNFVAMPGNNKTHLHWTNPTGDPTFRGIEIRFTRWSGYPEYLPPAPVYPADHTYGTLAGTLEGQWFDDNPRTPRDIYYYAAFSRDLAGNCSPLGTTAFDRCTSYWLGDVTADGLVNVSDLAAFSATYARLEGQPGWNALCDFGPTDDNSRFGVPLPDNRVNFEDLMIFSMNYSKVTPAGLDEYEAAPPAAERLAELVSVELRPNGDGTVSVLLRNRASTLKGIRIVVAVEDGDLDGVERGSLFDGAGDLFFGPVPAGARAADISAAALGTGAPLAASGELARLRIASSGERAARLRIVEIDLRDLDNARSGIAAAGEYEAPFVPGATALMQNFPNPFNPSTTLTFDLAAAGRVRIDIHDVTGRLVATPVDAVRAAGRHRVEWDGRDAGGDPVPSGIYLCRMRFAGFEATRKMVLLR